MIVARPVISLCYLEVTILLKPSLQNQDGSNENLTLLHALHRQIQTTKPQSSRRSREMETLFDVECDHGPVVNARVFVMQSEHEETEQHGREDLHLSVRELLSQANPWTSLQYGRSM